MKAAHNKVALRRAGVETGADVKRLFPSLPNRPSALDGPSPVRPQALRLAKKGWSPSQIASELGVGRTTVRYWVDPVSASRTNERTMATRRARLIEKEIERRQELQRLARKAPREVAAIVRKVDGARAGLDLLAETDPTRQKHLEDIKAALAKAERALERYLLEDTTPAVVAA